MLEIVLFYINLGILGYYLIHNKFFSNVGDSKDLDFNNKYKETLKHLTDKYDLNIEKFKETMTCKVKGEEKDEEHEHMHHHVYVVDEEDQQKLLILEDLMTTWIEEAK